MALAAQSRGNGSVARRQLKESIQHFREAGDAWFLANALNFEGKLALAAGESEQAAESFREAGKVALTSQALPMLLDAMMGLAMLDREQSQPERALLLVLHIVENPSSTRDTKNRSEKLREVLLKQLSETQIESSKARLQHTSFDSLVSELL